MLFSLATVSLMLTMATGHSAPCPVTNTTCYCPKDNDTCNFELTVEHNLTMMYYKKLVRSSGGKLYYEDKGQRIDVDRKCIYL